MTNNGETSSNRNTGLSKKNGPKVKIKKKKKKLLIVEY